MLADCTRLGLRRGILVYADLDGGAGDSTIIRNAGVEIITTELDISGSIEELRSSAAALAGLVNASASSTSGVGSGATQLVQRRAMIRSRSDSLSMRSVLTGCATRTAARRP